MYFTNVGGSGHYDTTGRNLSLQGYLARSIKFKTHTSFAAAISLLVVNFFINICQNIMQSKLISNLCMLLWSSAGVHLFDKCPCNVFNISLKMYLLTKSWKLPTHLSVGD